MNEGLVSHGESAPLLQKASSLYWRQVRSYWHSNKAILLILLWQFSTGILYNSLLQPPAYLHLLSFDSSIYIVFLLALVFLILSPLAGFLADVRYGRFKVLVCSSYFMLASINLILLAFLVMFIVHQLSYYFYIFYSIALLALVVYICSIAFFWANILQFGTDQLCDSPTHYSTQFLVGYYWCDCLSSLLCLGVNIPRHDIHISIHRHGKHININSLQALLFLSTCFSSAVMLTIVLVCLRRSRNSFMTVNIRVNPYKLVCNVIKFAVQHKKLIRRSAFTHCGDEFPSRLDFAKRRYGGPFTTEQVEDVRALFSMLKVLLSLSPVFFLGWSGSSSVLHIPSLREYNASNALVLLFINNGALSPLLAVTCIPLYLVTVKPLFSRCVPSMFKRMGLSVALLVMLFTCSFIWAVLARGKMESKDYHYVCKGNNSHSLPNISILPNNLIVWLTIEKIVSSLTRAILYIAVWKFICCQSPQYMKGLVFGLFYAMKAAWQFLAVGVKVIFFHWWRIHFTNCQSGYYLVNVVVGLICLITFTMVASRYKYRKRDDICNVYQYAEDYYSNFQ